MLEIELKASVGSMAPTELEQRMQAAGFSFRQGCLEWDTYYNAPDRDFKKTDEALRIREHRTPEGAKVLVTYKGPKLDALSNTRTEFETRVEDGDTLRSILGALGFAVILEVRKQRREYAGSGPFENTCLCLDEVQGLGSFLELEYCAEDGVGEEERDSIRDRLLSLLDELEIPRLNLTRQSYLELLIKRATS